ncbi:MAG: 30S ribosomal protein S6 [Candidatus Omnitrophota bacterium]
MNKYEAMFIVKPDLPDAEKKTLFGQISDAVTKSGGSVSAANIWSEKKKLYFPISKQHEGVYYLVNFSVTPDAIEKIRHTYKLNENILRVLITRV